MEWNFTTLSLRNTFMQLDWRNIQCHNNHKMLHIHQMTLPKNETLQQIYYETLSQLDWRNGCGGEDGCGDEKEVAVLLLEEQANK